MKQFNVDEWEQMPLFSGYDQEGEARYKQNYVDRAYINKLTGLHKLQITFTLEQQQMLDDRNEMLLRQALKGMFN